MENKGPIGLSISTEIASSHSKNCFDAKTVRCNQNRSSSSNDDSKNASTCSNESPLLQTLSFKSIIASSYEDCKNSTSASCDSINDFFGTNTSSSGSITKNDSKWNDILGAGNSDISLQDVESGANLAHNVDDTERSDNFSTDSYFNFLEDYIRFDISRSGVFCFSGYSVSVQYEDDFLVGNGGSLRCSFICGTTSPVRFWYGEEKAFELQYIPGISCTTPKNCVYKVKSSDEQASEIGSIHFHGNLVRIYNSYEKGLSFRLKQGNNTYLIKTENGERRAIVETFRGFRGDIIYYGLSILGDASSIDKAILIALTVTMDIRQRESDTRCSFLWLPLFCILVIGLFSALPWIFLYNENI